MYHILVVDDEKLMRTYLASNIPSFTDRFQVNGIAGDGAEAIELLNKQHFEVVITDIKMPEVDGLSLAKYIADNFPGIIVIIISGYDDFEYARTAIKYQVTDYLLKPLVDQNLALLLESIADRLDKQHSSGFLSTENISNETELKKALFSSILEENQPLTYQLFHQAKSRGLCCISDHYVLLKCLPDPLALLLKNRAAFDVTTDHLRLNQVLQDLCAGYGYPALYNTNGATYILVDSPDSSLLPEKLQELYSKLAFEKLPKVIFYKSQMINDMMKLPHALQEIRSMAPLSLLKTSRLILFPESESDREFIQAIHLLEEQIYRDYLACSVDNLYLDIGKFVSGMPADETPASNSFPHPSAEGFAVTLRLGSYLIQAICERAKITPAYQRNAFAELFRQIDLYLHAGFPDAQTNTQILTGTVCALISSPFKAPASEPGEIIVKAKKYILSHYQENISLSDVATYCGINSSYLSDLFHKTLKEPYTKYLLRIRMEQAARLLRQNPDMRVYTVAEQTGFVSVKHFNSVFKKYYGVTPKEFSRH